MADADRRSSGDWIAHKIRRMRRYGSLGAWARHVVAVNTRRRLRVDYAADGFGTSGKNLSFLAEPAFAEAWAETVRLNAEGWQGHVPDVAWRAHVACWAAQHALSLQGDFVECGVHTGILSRTICSFLDFGREARNFWLFDTWHGIPTDGMNEREAAAAKKYNEGIYHTDVYPITVRNFARYPNVRLVRGALPETLNLAKIDSISYLSIDLNNARAEKAVIERLWPKISEGAIIVLDDYGFRGCEEQHDMWDGFAREVGKMVVTIPTGQGILIK